MQPLGQGVRGKCILPASGQTTQYDSELDDGYWELGIPKGYTILTTGAQSGTTNVDLPHLISDTGAFVAATKTYTDVGKCGVFKAGGGETIIITGSGSNNGVFTTVSAAADTLVFVEAITDEINAPMTTFAKREAISNNVVVDNNVSVRRNGYPLHWLRYPPLKMGIAGDGQMPWTGQIYDIFQYREFAKAASLGGYADWRVANLAELFSLADFEAPTGVPNSTAFPSWANSYYISGTTRVDDTTKAWSWYYGGDGPVIFAKTNARRCMLVRG